MKVLDVQGFSFLLSHDTDITTMEAAAKQAMLLYGEKIDFMVYGHKHREAEAVSGYTDSGSALVVQVPSICGADRFAQRLGFLGKPGVLAIAFRSPLCRRKATGCHWALCMSVYPGGQAGVFANAGVGGGDAGRIQRKNPRSV